MHFFSITKLRRKGTSHGAKMKVQKLAGFNYDRSRRHAIDFQRGKNGKEEKKNCREMSCAINQGREGKTPWLASGYSRKNWALFSAPFCSLRLISYARRKNCPPPYAHSCVFTHSSASMSDPPRAPPGAERNERTYTIVLFHLNVIIIVVIP